MRARRQHCVALSGRLQLLLCLPQDASILGIQLAADFIDRVLSRTAQGVWPCAAFLSVRLLCLVRWHEAWCLRFPVQQLHLDGVVRRLFSRAVKRGGTARRRLYAGETPVFGCSLQPSHAHLPGTAWLQTRQRGTNDLYTACELGAALPMSHTGAAFRATDQYQRHPQVNAILRCCTSFHSYPRLNHMSRRHVMCARAQRWSP